MTLLCAGSILCLSGCGGGADATGETVFVYVLNGYPGSSKLTLYGPTGKLASGLPFGQRTEEAVVLDRNTNSNQFVLMIDGAPTTIEFSKELFTLYPQETATMVISRRSGEAAGNASLFRNTRTFSPTCVASFANSLSLNNAYMPTELLSYSYQTEWEVPRQTYYEASKEQTAETRCGETPIRQDDRDQRDVLIARVNDDPWFFPVTDDENYRLVWGQRIVDPRTNQNLSAGLIRGGIVRAYRDSEEFRDCMSAAVSVAEEEEQTDPNAPPAEECPAPTGPGGLLDESQVVWDEIAVLDCHDTLDYSGFPVTPGAEDSYTAFTQPIRTVGGEQMCGYTVRIRTPEQDLIFQNHDNTVPNYIDNIGGFVQVDATYPIGEHHYFVLFGRPVNPFVTQWNTAAEAIFSDGGDFPYPDDAVPAY
ncbi:hypothetical protein [Bradymonas sediminis]|nr:hypothetical protein [Bradymonas sediminis]